MNDNINHPLYDVFVSALSRAVHGKGMQRHGNAGTPFTNQPICTITRQVGLGFPLGQAAKKIYESGRLVEIEAATCELLDAINYLAAAIIIMKEGDTGENDDL